jgi:hypothetical protein
MQVHGSAEQLIAVRESEENRRIIADAALCVTRLKVHQLA